MMKYLYKTLDDAIKGYKLGDLTVKGLLRFYSEIHPKTDWTLKETQKEIYEQLGISRSAFYKALSELKANGLID